MRLLFTIYTVPLFFLIGCNSAADIEPLPVHVVKPILVDREVLSGLGLAPVANDDEPDRALFQQNLYRGEDISVYVVSSETATASHENYGIDEFIYLVNGRARIEDQQGEEHRYARGDFFVAPKGMKGEWETQGATNYHHELSVISTPRNQEHQRVGDELPLRLDQALISGQNMTLTADSTESYSDNLYDGPELQITTTSEISNLREIKEPLQEQLIHIISGTLTLTDLGGEMHRFTTGDFVIIPAGFKGYWECRGHRLFRCMRIMKSGF